MIVMIDRGSGEYELADLNETFARRDQEQPEYDFFGTCPKELYGRNPIYNAKMNKWEEGK